MAVSGADVMGSSRKIRLQMQGEARSWRVRPRRAQATSFANWVCSVCTRARARVFFVTFRSLLSTSRHTRT